MKKISVWVCAGVLAAALSGAACAQMRGSPGQMLDKADANQDGVVTREEYHQARMEMFEKLDRNDDGFVDQEDAPKFRRRSGGGGGERMDALKQELDKDGDGRISREEFAQGPMLVFEKADSNQDGKLDSAEIEAFKKFAEEAKAARKS
jgi:Ca2+-binding EF-hand superfamily protein